MDTLDYNFSHVPQNRKTLLPTAGKKVSLKISKQNINPGLQTDELKTQRHTKFIVCVHFMSP